MTEAASVTDATSTDITSTDTDSTNTTDGMRYFTEHQRGVLYITTFVIGLVTVIATPTLAAVPGTPAWVIALVAATGSAASTVSSAFGWKYLGK